MAVVQRLIRVTFDELAACRNSETALEQVISFELRPPEDYLDLDCCRVV